VGRSGAVDPTGGDATPTRTEWVYDLRGLDLADWAARAGDELAALTGPHDSIVMLVGEAEAAAVAALQAALAGAGYPMRHEQVGGIRALVFDRAPPSAATEEDA
jgi:hypothetical protein